MEIFFKLILEVPLHYLLVESYQVRGKVLLFPLFGLLWLFVELRLLLLVVALDNVPEEFGRVRAS